MTWMRQHCCRWRESCFHELFKYVIPYIVILGDFNSVVNTSDRFSGVLDKTSAQLSFLFDQHSFIELQGSHHYSFTYHHPLVPQRKSRLDRIYFNFSTQKLRGSTRHVSFSDHYLVEAYRLPDLDTGP